MAVRFICRLARIDLPNGKFRLEYGHLPGGSTFVIKGASVFPPPTQELSDDENITWLPPGFTLSFENVRAGAPLVETIRTIEDLIPPDVVSHQLFWVIGPQEQRTLGVELTNNWSEPIPNFAMSAFFKNEAPQPVAGFQGTITSGSDTLFIPAEPLPGRSLHPGQTVQFAYHPVGLDALKSRVAALSPESHWIALETDKHEFARIPGAEVAAFLEELDG